MTDPPPLSFTVNMAWDCNGAVSTSVTDRNNQPTTYTWLGSKLLATLTQTNYPDGGQINTTYNLGTVTPWNIIKTVKQTSTQNITSKTVYDSLARVSQQQLTSDPDGVVYTDTVYDTAGHTKSVSNPYRSMTESTYGHPYTYDGLHRVTVRTEPDGSTQQTTYAANCTTSTDETGKQRKTCTDGLGRLTQVIEDPTTGGLNYQTDYQYDTVGDLICAVQKGTDPTAFTNCASAPVTWRPRSFTYDLNVQVSVGHQPRVRRHQLHLRCQWKRADQSCSATQSNQPARHGNYDLLLRCAESFDSENLHGPRDVSAQVCLRRLNVDRVWPNSACNHFYQSQGPQDGYVLRNERFQLEPRPHGQAAARVPHQLESWKRPQENRWIFVLSRWLTQNPYVSQQRCPQSTQLAALAALRKPPIPTTTT